MTLKIVTINVRGIPSGSSANLIDARVFQDYDAVVVDPEGIEYLYDPIRTHIYNNREKGILEEESGCLIDNCNQKRRQEVDGLLQKGGIVVCFMEPVRICQYKASYRIAPRGTQPLIAVTNYDWLIEPAEREDKLGGIVYGKGQTIDYIDSNHPLFEYLKIKPSWSAFVKQERSIRGKWKVLASAYGTHAVSLTKRVGLGHIILLPSYYDHNNGALLEQCIRKLWKSQEYTPQPSWARAILVPGQKEIMSRLAAIDSHIGDLEKEKGSAILDNNKLERWKYLLYEKGKHQLEPVVRDALSLLGCNVEPQPDRDSDGIAITDYGTAMLEVSGSNGTIRIEKLGELTTNMGNYISTQSKPVKGILIGNPFCDEPIENRPPKDSQKQLFAKELIEGAEQQNITVLLSTDLYLIVSAILENRLTDEEKASYRRHIFTGKGLIRLIR